MFGVGTIIINFSGPTSAQRHDPAPAVDHTLSCTPFPEEPDIRRWSDMISSLSTTADRGSEDNMVALVGMLRECTQYFVPKIEDRREHPQDDILTDLVQADGADLMSATELVLFILVLLAAGNETTTNVIGSTVVQLLDNPDQLALLQADPSLLGSAIEESIRLQSPFQFNFREAVTDVELAGVTIPAGSVIAIMVGAANRDPQIYDHPNDFDLTRRTPHLGFGRGIHFCLGAPLARLETEIALGALLPRLHSYAVNKAGLRRHHSLLIYGYTSIPISVVAE